jgi:hypothetical protein
MNIISLQNRFKRAVDAMPPPVIIRADIERRIIECGFDVTATWRFVSAENPTRVRLEQLAFAGELHEAVSYYEVNSHGTG